MDQQLALGYDGLRYDGRIPDLAGLWQTIDRAISGELTPKDKLIALILRGYRRARLGSLIAAIEDGESALALLRPEDPADYEAHIRSHLGHVFMALGRNADALAQLHRALELTESAPITYVRFATLHNLAGLYVDHSAVERGIQHYEECLAIARTLKLASSVARVLEALAGAHMLKGDYIVAMELARDSARHAEEANAQRLAAIARVRMGTALVELGRFDEVLEIVAGARQTLASIPDGGLEATCYVLAGKSYRLLGRVEECRYEFERGLEHCRSLGNTRLLANALVLASELEVDLKNVDRAHALLDEAFKIANQTDDPYGRSACLEVWTNLSVASADYKAAFEYSERHHEAQQKVINEEGQRRLELLRFEREHQKLEQEREIYRMKSIHLEEKLALQTTSMASQTELLSTFRDELRKIVREINEPISALRKIKEKLKELPCEQIDWLKFEEQFQQVHPEFRPALVARYPELTKQEARICQLLRVGMKSHEIARLICISERGVENHRFNIRKKFGLRTEQSLTEFLSEIK